MKEGTLSRSFVGDDAGGGTVRVEALRFLSMANPEIGVMRYAVDGVGGCPAQARALYRRRRAAMKIRITTSISGTCWKRNPAGGEGFLLAQTRKLDFRVGFAMRLRLEGEGGPRAATVLQHAELRRRTSSSSTCARARPSR